MTVLITYDAKTNHTGLKNGLLAVGFQDRVPIAGGSAKLPNTTLVHATLVDPKQVLDLFQAVVARTFPAPQVYYSYVLSYALANSIVGHHPEPTKPAFNPARFGIGSLYR